MRLSRANSLSLLLSGVVAKALWSSSPASGGLILRQAFPVGNGRLGVMSFGQPGQEKLNLNIDSLWSGGPFESDTYNGGNPTGEKHSNLFGVRDRIFHDGVGDVSPILGSNLNYGSFRVLANLSIVISGITQYANFNRSLDLSTGVHTTTFRANDQNVYTTAVYCSHPAQACVYKITTTGQQLPNVAFSLENRLVRQDLIKTTCGPSNLRLTGVTKDGSPRGMEYDVLVRLSTGPLGMPMSSCSTTKTGTLVVTGSAYGNYSTFNSFSVIIGASTDYDQTKGNPANKYSFRGQSPGPIVERVTAQSSTKLESKLFISHTQDYQPLMDTFGLELFDPWKTSKYPSETLELPQLLDRYQYSTGNSRKPASFASKRDKTRSEKPRKRWKREPQAGWQPVTSTCSFPGFSFPTEIPAGLSVPDTIPWSTDGLATVTVQGGSTRTITLTHSSLVSGPTLLPHERLQQPFPEPTTGFELLTSTWAEESDEDPAPDRGDPYVESLLFDYAKYLFISSSRDDSLPPNLQGVWTDRLESAWSGDYHANINLQMNHWFADQVGLGDLQRPLWKYIQDTWVPRGTETAKLLYNAPGWVVHDEMNIFGHTGMKNTAEWANYPAAAAWMMQHVYDHWDYSRDLGWLQSTGYPMLREISRFWLSQLQADQYNRDQKLVVNPCNSPEIGPTTFGCTHYQQLIHQLLTNTLEASDVVKDPDQNFKSSLRAYLNSLDNGIHFSSWGGLKEFKLRDSAGLDQQGQQHRHISHLVGWYPGYSIASYSGGYGNATIQNAVARSLWSRGPGNSPDGNTGWGKVWRAAAWARLNNTEQADYHLRFAISTNIGPNGLSVYDGRNGPFQIDANFGLAGAMLSMLIVDMPQVSPSTRPRAVVLGPAIPRRWGPGRIRGLRVRGGTVLDMSWNDRGGIEKVSITKRGQSVRFYSVDGKVIGEI